MNRHVAGEESQHMKAKGLKRVEGEERNAEWRALSPEAQLASLDRRLGKGKGAKRQRAKLKEAVSK